MKAEIKPLNGEMIMTLSDELLEELGVKLGDDVNVEAEDEGVLRLETADGSRTVRRRSRRTGHDRDRSVE